MAHVGEKLRLGYAGRFGRLLRDFECSNRLGQLGRALHDRGFEGLVLGSFLLSGRAQFFHHTIE